MKYLVYGAGGTGGCLAAFLAMSGKDVSLIARGAHRDAIEENGLVLETGHGTFAVPIPAFEQEHYDQQPDVIFVCVKGYSLEGIFPTLERLCRPEAIVIPILNVVGTGGAMQPRLPQSLVTDGCVYIAAEIKAPGVVHMSGDIFRVVFGPRTPEEYRPELEQVAQDLNECGVEAILSDNIQRDAWMKFSVVSPMAACGIFHDVKVGAMQHPAPSGTILRPLSMRSALWPPPWVFLWETTWQSATWPFRTPWPPTPPPPSSGTWMPESPLRWTVSFSRWCAGPSVRCAHPPV